MFDFVTSIFLFLVLGLVILFQKESINELKSELKKHNKRIFTLEEMLSERDAALAMKIKLSKLTYNPNNDPAIKRFTDKLNRL